MSGAPRTDWSTQPVRRKRQGSSRIYGSVLPGVILIALGTVFLADSYFGYTLKNWWALFILIPAFASFANAYEAMQEREREHAMGSFVGGLGFTALAVAFLLDLDIGRLWPVALIIVGLGLLLSRRSRGWSDWG
jgi:ABC-type uncharacterized transport system permease subunit